ncbi:hypothetical protein [Streptodolium elevatio]
MDTPVRGSFTGQARSLPSPPPEHACDAAEIDTALSILASVLVKS